MGSSSEEEGAKNVIRGGFGAGCIAIGDVLWKNNETETQLFEKKMQKIFGHIGKRLYFCTRFQKSTSEVE